MSPAALPSIADEDDGGAVLAQFIGLAQKLRGRDAAVFEKTGIADRRACGPRPSPRTPFPAGASKPEGSANARPRSSAAFTIAAASGCSLARSRLAARRKSSSSPKSAAGPDRHDLGLAFGERAGLVDDERVDLFHALQRLGVLDEHARLRAAPDADHDRHRRREPERAGTSDDQDRDGGDEPVGKARLGSENRPGGEGGERHGDHQRHEPARRPDRRGAGSARGSFAPSPTIWTIWASKRIAADLFRAHDEGAGLIERARDDLGARLLAHRHGFAGDERFVDGRAAIENRAVDRHFLARPHAQAVANEDRVEAHFLVAAVVADTPRGLWREVEQRLDRVGGLLARPQLQHLAEQDENGDDGGRLEIDGDRAVRGCGTPAGRVPAPSVATTL